ncbi:hypothetical protein BI292_13660 [Pseudomonas sp. 43NM1]|uniref:hypothetical protein n=1 Tax=Pseudomonas sp. 43NM1 TaxID=1904755 RepID=UPI000C322E3E|nr:hypothetical protein [Pseudomonas sp. 43NM1]PKH24206.1 hypothetical protein BI292_13660 [Pseudomonas sp. 43NM1]
MEDDLIDDSGFELGMPSHVEMLKHYCWVLEAELDTTRRDLRRAHQTIGGMIVMHRDLAKELSVLKADYQRVSQRLSQFYDANRAQEVAKMSYAYGDYAKR